jgi:hypothetical protein
VQGAGEPKGSPSDPGKLVDRAVRFWGYPTVSETTLSLLGGFAKAQLGRKQDPAVVETALRRLIATSPDVQTA